MSRIAERNISGERQSSIWLGGEEHRDRRRACLGNDGVAIAVEEEHLDREPEA